MTTKKGAQKLYRNAGASQLVFEGVTMEPGSEFRATLPPEQEQQLLLGGHLEILEDQSAKADAEQAALAEEGTETNVAAEGSTNRRKR